jgi:hypothetical protein
MDAKVLIAFAENPIRQFSGADPNRTFDFDRKSVTCRGMLHAVAAALLDSFW